LQADEVKPARMVAGQLGETSRLDSIRGQRPFAVHVFAGGDCRACDLGVFGDPNRDGDDVDLVVVEHRVEVVARRDVPQLAGCAGGVWIRSHESLESDSAGRGDGRYVRDAAPLVAAHAYQRDPECITHL